MSEENIIFISESILRYGIVPEDLLDSERFSIRSVQNFDELLILAKAITIKAVVLDLGEFADLDIGVTQKLREVHSGKGSFPVLGIISPENMHRADDHFNSGISNLLQKPIDQKQLRVELEILLEDKLRKFERKEIAWSVTLTQGEEEWPVRGKVVNRECIVVDGSAYPPLGTNVKLQASPDENFQVNLWVHVWRKNKNGYILRFLNPSEKFLLAIDQLAVQKNVEDSGWSEEIVIIDIDKSFEKFARQQMEVFEGIPDEVKEKINHFSSTKPLIAKSLLLESLISQQLQFFRRMGIAIDKSQIPKIKGIVQKNETVIDQLQVKLHQLVSDLIQNKEEELVIQVNEIKSSLQKHKMQLNKNLTVMEMVEVEKTKSNAPTLAENQRESYDGQETPARKPLPKKEKAGFQYQKIAGYLAPVLAILVIAAGVYIGTLLMNSKRGTFGDMSTNDVQTLSKFILSAKKHQGRGRTSLTIFLSDRWLLLDDEKKQDEMESIRNKFEVLGIHAAKIMFSDGREYARIFNGQIFITGKNG